MSCITNLTSFVHNINNWRIIIKISLQNELLVYYRLWGNRPVFRMIMREGNKASSKHMTFDAYLSINMKENQTK